MVDQASFWDKAAAKYATQPIGNMPAYEATLDRVRHHLTPEMSVLELGCGTGSTALRLADAVAQITGSDISAEMVHIATGKAEAEGADNVRFVQADALVAGEGGFDAVMAFNLIHLLGDIDGTLAHVRGLLPEGGLFMSKTPCLGGKFYFAPLIWIAQKLGKAPKPVHMLRPAALEAAITRAGFEIIETAGLPPKLPSHFVVARAV